MCPRYSGGDLLVLLGLVAVGFSLPYLFSHAGSVLPIVATYAIPAAIAFVAIAYDTHRKADTQCCSRGRGIHCLGLDHEGTNCRAEAWGSMEASKDAEVRCGSIPTVAGGTYHITSYPILSYHIISHSASVGRKH